MIVTKRRFFSSLAMSSLLIANYQGQATKTNNYDSTGAIEFEASLEPELPLDPENPNPNEPVEPIDPSDPNGPNPGTAGPLSIDFASSLNFGKNRITNKDMIYYANAQAFSGSHSGQYRGNYVQVSDNRGTNDGWILTVAQSGQFTNETAKKYKILTGAQVRLMGARAVSNSAEIVEKPQTRDVSLDPEGAASLVMFADEGDGTGTWLAYFGKAKEVEIEGEMLQKNEAITMFLPGSTPKEAVEYQTDLTWTLASIPKGY